MLLKVERNRVTTPPKRFWGLSNAGFSMAEVLITLIIFSVLLAGVFGAFFSQLKHSTREYRVAESEVELGIAKRFIEQDLQMSGFGLADDYGSTGFAPRPAKVVNSNAESDQLYLMGTALGVKNRASSGWSYFTSVTPTLTFKIWTDEREQIKHGDRAILIEPSSRSLLTEPPSGTAEWLFVYDGMTPGIATTGGTSYSSAEKGTLIYGLYTAASADSAKDGAARPYYTVYYHLGGASPTLCAPDTDSLLRVESVTTETPTGGDPLLACVLDMQVAFGLDTDEDGVVDFWDDGGTTAKDYTLEELNHRLKWIKLFLLVQSGNRDDDYTYPLDTVRVGEAGMGWDLGRDVNLSAEQRHYRWHLLSLNIQPRNVR